MNSCFYGAMTVGDRGQVVIPVEARADLNIHPGDKLILLKHPIYKGLVVTKIEALQECLQDFSEIIENLKSTEPTE